MSTKAGRPSPKMARIAETVGVLLPGGEGAALIEHAHDRLRHHQKGRRRRQGQEQRELDRAVLQVRGFLQIAGLQRARQFRQQHDGDRDADDAERQLVDAVGIGERRNRAVLSRCDGRADQLVDLGDAAGDRRRKRQHQQALHVGRETRPPEADGNAGMPHGDPDDRQLHQARGQHAPGQRVADGQAVMRPRTRHKPARRSG